MHDVATPEHLAAARRLRHLSSLYEHNRDLITIGAYQRGSDPRVDEALARHAHVDAYLRQDMHERVGFAESIGQLQQFADGTTAH